ncbi:MAG: hypothetical protein JSV80_05925, partial [Acidobacteriota bacterium]
MPRPLRTNDEDLRPRRRSKRVKAFREWENKYYDELATIYRAFHKLMRSFKTMEKVEEFAGL